MGRQRYPALDLAMGVVYHPVFDSKPHEGIMARRVESASQDYKKLIALAEYRYPNGTAFCKEATMLFVSNTHDKTALRKKLDSIPVREGFPFLILEYS